MDYFKTYNEPGSPPGAWEQAVGAACTVRVVRYSAQDYAMEESFDPARCAQQREAGHKLWVAVEGVPGPELLRALAECFGLHHLALEDVSHAGQRAKVEEYDDQLFVVLRCPRWEGRQLAIGQTSLFLGKDFVVSINDAGGDLFLPVRRRLESSPGGRIRSHECDYLFYALVDLVVDQGFPILEGYAEELEELELTVMRDPREKDLRDRIHESRRELVFLRRALWAQREAAADLLRLEHPLIRKSTRVYLRDCLDHASHMVELADSYRDMSSAVLELLLSSINSEMNDIMRVLTMIATIFIPLSFVVGLYGMNFDRAASPWNMPELGWRYGYPLILVLLITIGMGMVVYFRRKRWL